MTRVTAVQFKAPLHEMAQEEVLKQVSYLSGEISRPRFVDGGTALEFEVVEGADDRLSQQVLDLGNRVQRSLRSLERKVVFRSTCADRPPEHWPGEVAGVHQLGRGQVALEGLPLRLLRYFDRTFEAFGDPWRATPLMTPALIPVEVLAKCDYFRSFPYNVTFACHLPEDPARIADFCARHQRRDDLDEGVCGDLATPEACLSPAVCYHVYAMHRDRSIPADGLTFGVCGNCFRYESTNMTGLKRLWDFTLREVVFMGAREAVLENRERTIGMMSGFLEEHQLAGEIRTASDPFFIAPDALAKTYFQLSSETKYEISLMLPDGERLAVGSHNYHTDFFGRAFNVDVEGAGAMHSVCVGFGLERWVYAFLVQHGVDPARWPAAVREAPEFLGR